MSANSAVAPVISYKIIKEFLESLKDDKGAPRYPGVATKTRKEMEALIKRDGLQLPSGDEAGKATTTGKTASATSAKSNDTEASEEKSEKSETISGEEKGTRPTSSTKTVSSKKPIEKKEAVKEAAKEAVKETEKKEAAKETEKPIEKKEAEKKEPAKEVEKPAEQKETAKKAVKETEKPTEKKEAAKEAVKETEKPADAEKSATAKNKKGAPAKNAKVAEKSAEESAKVEKKVVKETEKPAANDEKSVEKKGEEPVEKNEAATEQKDAAQEVPKNDEKSAKTAYAATKKTVASKKAPAAIPPSIANRQPRPALQKHIEAKKAAVKPTTKAIRATKDAKADAKAAALAVVEVRPIHVILTTDNKFVASYANKKIAENELKRHVPDSKYDDFLGEGKSGYKVFEFTKWE